jgi:hypothetical protein
MDLVLIIAAAVCFGLAAKYAIRAIYLRSSAQRLLKVSEGYWEVRLASRGSLVRIRRLEDGTFRVDEDPSAQVFSLFGSAAARAREIGLSSTAEMHFRLNAAPEFKPTWRGTR